MDAPLSRAHLFVHSFVESWMLLDGRRKALITKAEQSKFGSVFIIQWFTLT